MYIRTRRLSRTSRFSRISQASSKGFSFALCLFSLCFRLSIFLSNSALAFLRLFPFLLCYSSLYVSSDFLLHIFPTSWLLLLTYFPISLFSLMHTYMSKNAISVKQAFYILGYLFFVHRRMSQSFHFQQQLYKSQKISVLKLCCPPQLAQTDFSFLVYLFHSLSYKLYFIISILYMVSCWVFDTKNIHFLCAVFFYKLQEYLSSIS